MVPNLNPQDVIAWLRHNAKKINEAADILEASMRGGPPTVPKMTFAQNGALKLGIVTPEGIRKYVEKKGARLRDLAKSFNVSESDVTKAIEDSGGDVAVALRGWVKTREQILADGDALKKGGYQV